jgi:hypothetical protein
MGKRQRRRQREAGVRKLPNESVADFQARVFDALTDMDEAISRVMEDPHVDVQ